MLAIYSLYYDRRYYDDQPTRSLAECREDQGFTNFPNNSTTVKKFDSNQSYCESLRLRKWEWFYKVVEGWHQCLGPQTLDLVMENFSNRDTYNVSISLDVNCGHVKRERHS